MKSIEVKDLSFGYKAGNIDITIFDSFNIEVEKGDFVAIKGPSGSGKSTLLYLFAGLLKFKSGKVMIKGQDISKLSDLHLSLLRNKEIGFVFQQFHLLPKTTVLDNILLPSLYPIEELKDNSQHRQRAIDIANDLGIGDRLDHHPNQLSGGQQQRVAIARALMNNPEIILADEPTGNLDTKSTEQIIKIFKELHAKGKTIVLITHEEEVAKVAAKTYFLRDGKIVEQHVRQELEKSSEKLTQKKYKFELNPLKQYLKIIPLVLKNAFRNRTRSILTMIGITVGVAAVCSMVTLGNFTKEKILDSYAELGVNTMMFRGYPNWNLKATDQFPTKFSFFDWEDEILPLKIILPQIQSLSPSMSNWQNTVTFGGISIENEPRLIGVSEEGLRILGRELLAGKAISQFHVERRSFVCVIGFDIGKRLFKNVSPLGQVIHISQDESTFACKVLGILKSKTSNKDWAKPNLQIYMPFTSFQAVSERWWSSQIKRVTIQVKQGADVEKVGEAVKKFFEMKYGKSGEFNVDSDSILLAQMKKFLNLFSVLLAAIALVTLTVGGMGIANMMLVSVSERLKEIGIRKSIGATHASIRNQFLMESLVLCFFAGIIGLIVGVIAYQSAIYGASRLTEKLEFEWVWDSSAIVLSLVSIITVGLLSGLAPAMKAEKLQVIDALRSE